MMVAIVMEAMMAVAAPAIKEVGHLSRSFVLLDLGHHHSFQSKKNLEATMPLMMPFVQSILFSMCLLNLQETQVVCR
jgi:hypothetical protein